MRFLWITRTANYCLLLRHSDLVLVIITRRFLEGLGCPIHWDGPAQSARWWLNCASLLGEYPEITLFISYILTAYRLLDWGV
jgi:hypothetical protein